MKAKNERIQLIRQRLIARLHPTVLEINDESYLHKGHVGVSTGMGHFSVTIASQEFQGKPLLECHRIIYKALDELMHSDIHALKIKILP